ncbi:SCO6880 family protein, partial [Kitasatospora aburaviensis]
QINVAGRRNVFLSGVFAPRRPDGTQGMDLPGVLARLRLLSVPTGAGEEMGVLFDPRTNCYSAVMEVRFPGLALVDTGRATRAWPPGAPSCAPTASRVGRSSGSLCMTAASRTTAPP